MKNGNNNGNSKGDVAITTAAISHGNGQALDDQYNSDDDVVSDLKTPGGPSKPPLQLQQRHQLQQRPTQHQQLVSSSNPNGAVLLQQQ